jgi:hypothetical protein
MVKSVEGIYRNGKVELVEPLTEAEGSRVILSIYANAPSVKRVRRGLGSSRNGCLR